MYPLTRIVGNELGKLALTLLSIHPSLGSLLVVGERGTGKTRLVRSLSSIRIPITHCPPSITEEQMVSGLHLKQSLEGGQAIFQAGFLERSQGKIILADDIHLMNKKCFHLLMEAGRHFYRPLYTTKENRKILDYAVVATLSQEETHELKGLKDYFTMIVSTEKLSSVEEHIRVMEQQICFIENPEKFYLEDKAKLREMDLRIKKARQDLGKVFVPYPLKQRIVARLEELKLRGNHWEERLIQVLRASAAYHHRETAYEEDLAIAMKLVLELRDDEQGSQKKAAEPKQQKQQKQQKSFSLPQNFQNDLGEERWSGEGKEEVFSIGKGELPLFQNSRKKLKTDFLGLGKKERSITKDLTGRKVWVRSSKKWQDIDLYATLIKASPHQRARGYRLGNAFIIKERDLQCKVRERGVGHYRIILLDSSGSLAVDRRMSAVKGAVFHLLKEAYVKRDKVALLSFRKKKAEILLPLTRSLYLAKQKLEELPSGGNTPLGMGLSKALSYIESIKVKEPQAIFKLYVISDGRTNWSAGNLSPLDEAREYAKKLCMEQVTIYYIDYEQERFPLQFMRELAELSQGQYYKIDSLTEEALTQLIMR